jgi:hypothetical protein
MYPPVLNRLVNRQSEKQKEQLVQEFHQVVGARILGPLSGRSRLLSVQATNNLGNLDINQA